MAIDRRARRGGIAAISAGGLVALALVGPMVWDGYWLALAPATALVMMLARELHVAWRPRDGRIGAVGAFVLAVAAGGLLALMLIGSVATAHQGAEPAWLALPDQVAGYGFLAGAALFGVAALRAQAVPRWAAMAFAVSLPLGVGLDAATKPLPLRRALLLRRIRVLPRVGTLRPVPDATRLRRPRPASDRRPDRMSFTSRPVRLVGAEGLEPPTFAL